MPKKDIAYLGPAGTYSHLVAEKRFGKSCHFVPLPTVTEVCRYVARQPDRCGIIPIENSSGGAIYETVDILLAGKPRIHILEELSLNVKLALLGRKQQRIHALYSHFAPLEHCESWIKTHLPRVEKRVVNSTAAAARMAFLEDNAAALGNRMLADLYNLQVLHYPVEAELPNLTIFLAIAGRKTECRACTKTTIAAMLPNEPGALCTFLEAFREYDVNLSRIISRPMRGCPREYAFLVDMVGSPNAEKTRQALKAARRHCVRLRVAGSFPCRQPYQS